jgi:hypothetical protein
MKLTSGLLDTLLHTKEKVNIAILSLNSPRIFIILDIHQQNAQITNKVQIAPC